MVLVKKKRMQDSWCLATSLTKAPAAQVIELYSRRFTIEEAFRDTKDLHFGLGLSATHIRDADRRDRLLMLIAVAHSLPTLLWCGRRTLRARCNAQTEYGQDRDAVFVQPGRLLVTLAGDAGGNVAKTDDSL